MAGWRAVKGFLRNDCRDIRWVGGWPTSEAEVERARRKHRISASFLPSPPAPIWPSFGLLPEEDHEGGRREGEGPRQEEREISSASSSSSSSKP